MPTQTELEFYKAFNIKPLKLSDCSFINIKKGYTIGTDVCPATEDETFECKDCKYSKIAHKIYPEITDRRLLELICVNNKYYVNLDDLICPTDIETIKDDTLKAIIERWMYSDTYHAVRKIMGVE